MAQCGCSSGCSCLITVKDTPTLNLHISGRGTGNHPYELSGDVAVSLVAGPTGPTGPTGPAGAPAVGAQDKIFTYQGALVSGATSPPVRLRSDATLTTLAVTLGTAGSTDTVLEVLKNGVSVATVTVPTGATVYDAVLSIPFLADIDKLALSLTSAGTGAADMTADARF